ncbi:MAG: hypothetical protein ACYCQI_11370 [Gammaproteobacteria bacterium]
MLVRPEHQSAIELEKKVVLERQSGLPQFFLSDIKNILVKYDKAWLKNVDSSNVAYVESLRHVCTTLEGARVKNKNSVDSPLTCEELMKLAKVLLDFTRLEREKNSFVELIFNSLITKFSKNFWEVIKTRKKRISAPEFALMAQYPNHIGRNFVDALNRLDSCECYFNNQEIRDFISQPEFIERSARIVDAFFILEPFFKPRATRDIINLMIKFLKEDKQLLIAYYIKEIAEEYSPKSSAPIYDLCVSSSKPLADIHQLRMDLLSLTFCRNANFDYVTQLMCSHPKDSTEIAHAYSTLIDKKICVIKHREISPIVKFVTKCLLADGNTNALQAVCIIKDKLGVVSENMLQALNSKEAREIFINITRPTLDIQKFFKNSHHIASIYPQWQKSGKTIEDFNALIDGMNAAEAKAAPQKSKPQLLVHAQLFAEKYRLPEQIQDDIAVTYRAYPL